MLFNELAIASSFKNFIMNELSNGVAFFRHNHCHDSKKNNIHLACQKRRQVKEWNEEINTKAEQLWIVVCACICVFEYGRCCFAFSFFFFNNIILILIGVQQSVTSLVAFKSKSSHFGNPSEWNMTHTHSSLLSCQEISKEKAYTYRFVSHPVIRFRMFI